MPLPKDCCYHLPNLEGEVQNKAVLYARIMEKNSYAKQQKNPIFYSDLAEQPLCCMFSSAGSLETGKFILIYLFKLKILVVTSEVYVYYQLQCTCHSFGWKGSQGRI